MNDKLYINANSLNPIFSKDGGIYRGARILLYGIAGGGKTTCSLTLALNELDLGNPVVFIDADFFGLHTLKLQELYHQKYGVDFPADKFKSPQEHQKMIYQLWKIKGLHIIQVSGLIKIDLALTEVKKIKPSLIIIDSITQYYRIDVMKSDFQPAKIMMKLLNSYVLYAQSINATLIFTAQRVSEVKMTMNKDSKIAFREFVGGEVLHHMMDNIIELRIRDDGKTRLANTSIKHRNDVQKEKMTFKIVGGLVE